MRIARAELREGQRELPAGRGAGQPGGVRVARRQQQQELAVDGAHQPRRPGDHAADELAQADQGLPQRAERAAEPPWPPGPPWGSTWLTNWSMRWLSCCFRWVAWSAVSRPALTSWSIRWLAAFFSAVATSLISAQAPD